MKNVLFVFKIGLNLYQKIFFISKIRADACLILSSNPEYLI